MTNYGRHEIVVLDAYIQKGRGCVITRFEYKKNIYERIYGTKSLWREFKRRKNSGHVAKARVYNPEAIETGELEMMCGLDLGDLE